MARFRLARPAQIDLATILAASGDRWGLEGRHPAEATQVRRPVHVLYYRVAQKGVIEIVRVLHERMEASSHLDELLTERDS